MIYALRGRQILGPHDLPGLWGNLPGKSFRQIPHLYALHGLNGSRRRVGVG